MRLGLAIWLLVNVSHALVPYTSWALGPSGLVMTPPAYLPLAEIPLPLTRPEDLVWADGWYVADSAEGRVLKFDRNFLPLAEIGAGVLRAPTGVAVDDAGTIYVADPARGAVLVFDAGGQLLRELTRPTSALFGARREFRPRKLALDARGNLYVVSEGSVDGLVMLSPYGDFLGYFGANTAELSLVALLRRLLLSREQLAQFVRREAPSPSNVAIDSQGLVYTVTAGARPERSIRKFNFAGRNLLPDIYGANNLRALDVSDGLIAAVSADGHIFEYHTGGTLLFYFGAADRGDGRLGLLDDPVAIVRREDRLYVLERDRGAVVIYRASAFAQRLHRGVRDYMAGRYLEAKPHFEAVLGDYGQLTIAHQAIADAYFLQGEFAKALAHYRYAEDRAGYSEAFWELRNAVLQRHLGSGLLAALALGGSVRLWRRRHRRPPARRWFSQLQFIGHFLARPADGFYLIKAGEQGNIGMALLLYLGVIAARVFSAYLTGFSFSPYARPEAVPAAEIALVSALALALWNAANYLVAAISDGEGRWRDVVIASAYSLAPLALFELPIALASNLLTLNEAFVYHFSRQLVWLWSGVMLVVMVKEIHNYTVAETARNLLATLLAMTALLVSGYILTALFGQLYDFVATVIQEVRLRA